MDRRICLDTNYSVHSSLFLLVCLSKEGKQQMRQQGPGFERGKLGELGRLERDALKPQLQVRKWIVWGPVSKSRPERAAPESSEAGQTTPNAFSVTHSFWL